MVEQMRREIESLGGEVRFQSRVAGLHIEHGAVRGAVLASGEEIEADHVVLALGHSARDTFAMLHAAGVFMEEAFLSATCSCVLNNSYSANTNPQPNNQPNPSQLQSAAMSCGGTNWTGVTRPSQNYTTLNPFWVSNVLPTIQWMKNACPTCYTFPYDDMLTNLYMF